MTNIVINKNENKPVIMKLVYRVELNLVSPVCVSSGQEGMTDSDVIRDYDGNPFIPGTSLAGAFRDYVTSGENELFGYIGDKDDNGKMSPLFISDLTFDGPVNIDYRDSVALTDDKTSEDGAKFDFEVVECKDAHFFMELTVRDKDSESTFNAAINEIFKGIQRHEIRLGSKKTRGYGIIEIKDIFWNEYSGDGYLNYAECYSEGCNYNNRKKCSLKEQCDAKQWVHIEVPLKQRGGISIRRYLIQTDGYSKENLPDYESLTNSKGDPVIPGTSFSGAIRHRVKEILKELLYDENIKEEKINEKIQETLKDMFGSINETKSHKSRIIIDETVIRNENENEKVDELVTVRNSVSRFEGATVDGALFKEKTYVNGILDLKIAVENSSETDWIIGLILLAINDLQNGFLAVGGQTTIGRGLFEANGSISIDGNTMIDKKYNEQAFIKINKLKEELRGQKNG